MVEGGGGRSDGVVDKAREEFFSEAQELVDALGRDLLAIDYSLRSGITDPEKINDVFRAVHTLKGLSGLFGAVRMAGLSHELEDVLDDLRLGRIELSQRVLDLLFQSVEIYGRLLAAEKEGVAEPASEVEALLLAFGQVTQRKGATGTNVIAQYELDPGLLGVLTEYEEHRLRSTIQSGAQLFRVHVKFALATIDSALDELKAKAKPHGEIITYLPTESGGDIDTIELEILMASHVPFDVLDAAMAGPDVRIEPVKRRAVKSVQPARTSLAPPRPRDGDLPDPRGLGAPRAPSPIDVVDEPPRAVSLAPGPMAPNKDLSLRSVSQTVRVDIRKLDRLMTVVGELAIVRTALLRLAERVRARPELRELGSEVQRLHRSFDRHLGQMQNGILEVRMVPLGQVFDKLARVVRQISREHDKQVNLVITGAETEIDKLIVEELSDPLMHMIRNAIDHGIETQGERTRVGKPPVGTIALNAYQKGNHVLIEVEDDGAGMDPSELAASAVDRGIVTFDEAEELSRQEVLALVFRPGFTTRSVATDLSGRGVGLDVVKTNIGKLGGLVDITSEVGIGTKMTVTLPITLAIIRVLVVDIASSSYAIPLATVEEAIAFDEPSVRTIEGREFLTVRGASLPICRLARLFGNEQPGWPSARSYVVIAQVGQKRLGLVVDRLEGQQDIVIKPLGRTLRSVRGFAGAAELGDQRVALVLDAASIIDEVLASDGATAIEPEFEIEES
ncbi:MAG: chemotaxis protein CheA [Polyangiaceae bacterium]